MTDTGDKLFYPDEGERPKIAACLIHTSRPAHKSYWVKDNWGTVEGVTYGLCANCVKALANDEGFRIFLDRTLQKRLKELIEQQEREAKKNERKNV